MIIGDDWALLQHRITDQYDREYARIYWAAWSAELSLEEALGEPASV